MAVLGFLLFTGGVLGLTIWMTRKDDHDSAKGYFLGGRSLTGGVIAGSLMLTNLSTEQLTGLSGQAFSQGIHVMAWEVFAAFAMVILAFVFLPRYLKRGITTTPQYLEDRFDKTTRSMVSILFLFGYAFILLPVVLYTGALTVNGIFDAPALFGVSKGVALWMTVWGIGVLGSIYAIWGGLKAVAVSDTINAVGLLFGGLMIPYLGLVAVGEGSLFTGLNTLVESHPERFVSNGSNVRVDGANIPWWTLFTGMLLINLYYWCTNQAITQRCLGAKNLKEAQKGVLLAAFLKILGPLVVVLPGIIAFHLYGDQVVASGNADEAYPVLVRNLLGNGFVKGLFAAVLVGAILSSFNSALNSASTLYSLGIYKDYLKKDASDIQVVKSGKIFGILLAVFAMTVAPFLANAGSIFSYLQTMNGVYNVPVITIFLVGFMSKKVSATSAKFAIVFGSFFYSFSAFAGDLQGLFAEGGALYSLFGTLKEIHFLHHFAIACVVAGASMFLFPKRSEAYEQKATDDVDITPWSKLKMCSFVICVFAASVYAVTWNTASPVKKDLVLESRFAIAKSVNELVEKLEEKPADAGADSAVYMQLGLYAKMDQAIKSSDDEMQKHLKDLQSTLNKKAFDKESAEVKRELDSLKTEGATLLKNLKESKK